MTARFVVADVFDGIATLEDGSVDLVVTSPPFLALRSYLPADHPDKAKEMGSEATPGEFLDRLLDVVEALAPKLAAHGSLVFELGDTYAGSGGRGEASLTSEAFPWREVGWASEARDDNGHRIAHGAGWPLDKSKVLIPQLFAIALAYGFNPLTGRQTDPWRVRNQVAWCRPNPPVGRDGDKFRPATSFLTVACKGRDRYWDGDAVRVPYAELTMNNGKVGREGSSSLGEKSTANRDGFKERKLTHAGAPLLDWWDIPGETGPPPEPKPKSGTHRRTAKGVDSVERTGKSADRGGNWSTLRELGETDSAPLLDWWELPTHPYPGAHYATFPPALVVPLVKSMCPRRVCRTCGKPSERIVEVGELVATESACIDNWDRGKSATDGGTMAAHLRRDGFIPNHEKPRSTLGWSDCGHDSWRPGRVLDPFAGSGTTLAVASGHGFDAVGFDLDPRNADLARERCGMFLEVEARPLPEALTVETELL